MTAHLDGYPLGVEYPSRYHRETSPAWIVATATALGRPAPDLTRPFRWLELGSGTGLGAAVTAACWPQAEVVAVDAHPGHVARTRRWARDAGLKNLLALEASFERLAGGPDDALAPCDFIVLHGVWAWVSEANRQAITALARRWLRPGGLLYVSYMSQPGATALSAAQKLMTLVAGQIDGPPERQLRAGLDLLQRLRQAGAGCFVEHPGLARQLEHMAQEDPRYLAHEFLGRHWQPQHVTDVMAAFARADCRYVGSATPLENIDRVSVPGGVLPLLQHLRDPALGETLRDMARHQSLRRDLYQRLGPDGGEARLDAAAHREALLRQAIVALPGAPQHGPIELATRIGPVELPADLVDPLLQALGSGPRRYGELARLPAYAAQPGMLNQLFQVLAWSGQVHPFDPDFARRPSASEASQASGLASTAAIQLNRLLSAPAEESPEPLRWLVAPALGTALAIDAPRRWIARALLRHPGLSGGTLQAAVREAAREDAPPVGAASHPAPASAPTNAELDATVHRFELGELARWQAWGVVPPPGGASAPHG